MSKRILDIEGIGEKHAQALRAVGITTTDALLKAGATRLGRSDLAAKSGLSETLILKWVNMADLFRIKGVASQYAELLEGAGVDTVKELRNRNIHNLAERIAQVNEEKRLVRQLPSTKLVADWVEQAKSIPPVVTY